MKKAFFYKIAYPICLISIIASGCLFSSCSRHSSLAFEKRKYTKGHFFTSPGKVKMEDGDAGKNTPVNYINPAQKTEGRNDVYPAITFNNLKEGLVTLIDRKYERKTTVAKNQENSAGSNISSSQDMVSPGPHANVHPYGGGHHRMTRGTWLLWWLICLGLAILLFVFSIAFALQNNAILLALILGIVAAVFLLIAAYCLINWIVAPF